MKSGHGDMLKRLSVMVGGEAMQSGFHFALNIVLIHMLSAYSYGVFAMVMVMGGIGLAYIRALTAAPASIWIGRSTHRAARDTHDVTFGSVAALLAAVLGVSTGLLIEIWAGSGAIAAGCLVGLWSLRSHLRTVCFARRQQAAVSVSDLAFTLSGAAMTAVAIWYSSDILGSVFVALAVAHALGIALLIVQSKQKVRVSFRPTIRGRYMALWPQLSWSGISCTIANIQGQCVALLVGGLAGPAAFAPIAAVLTLFAPLRIVATAFVNMMQPELSALLAKKEPLKVWAQAKVWSLAMSAGSLIYAVGMYALLPFIESDILKNASIETLWIFAWATYAFTILYAMPRIILEILGDFRIVALVIGIGAVVGLALIAVILTIAPAPWALVGAAASEATVCVASWICARNRILALANLRPRQAMGGQLTSTTSP